MTLLHVVFICIFVAVQAESSKSFSWQLDSSQDVTAYQTTTSTLSAISCVGKCTRHSHCDSCAYDRESGTCHLQVQTASNDLGGSLQVFKAASSCKISQTHVDYATTNVTWKRTGWEMDGDVICEDDQVFSTGSPTFHCSANGTWTSKTGECQQSVWKNPQVRQDMPMPRAPVPGWIVCMNGSFPTPNKFYINFKNNNGDIMLHVSTRLDAMNVALSVRPSGQRYSGSEYDLDPFPILANQPYMITIRAVSLFDLQYFVDGKLNINHTVPRSLGSVQTASLGDAPTLDALDLWCGA